MSTEIIGEAVGMSKDTVKRYIRLTNLIPEILDMVDEKKIAFNPAVELSYLKPSEQKEFLEAMDYAQASPSLSQAQRLKKLSQEGDCTLDAMCEVMNEIKKDELDHVTVSYTHLDVYKRQSPPRPPCGPAACRGLRNRCSVLRSWRCSSQAAVLPLRCIKVRMPSFPGYPVPVSYTHLDVYKRQILNFANCDMVGHTGGYEAACRAVTAVDECVGRVVEATSRMGGVSLITADHGNAERMADEDGEPFTAHTTNLVPVSYTHLLRQLGFPGLSGQGEMAEGL